MIFLPTHPKFHDTQAQNLRRKPCPGQVWSFPFHRYLRISLRCSVLHLLKVQTQLRVQGLCPIEGGVRVGVLGGWDSASGSLLLSPQAGAKAQYDGSRSSWHSPWWQLWCPDSPWFLSPWLVAVEEERPESQVSGVWDPRSCCSWHHP